MTHQISQKQKPFKLAVVLVMLIGTFGSRSVVSHSIRAFGDAAAESTEAQYDALTETTPEEDTTVLYSTFGEKAETTEGSTTGEVALSLEELNSLGMLDDTSTTIQATQLFLNRQKTQMSLKFLNKILPIFESIRKNMTDLLNNTPADLLSLQSMAQSFATYKQADDALENKLIQAEGEMSGNRNHTQIYVQAYSGVERELAAFHRTLGNILFPQSNLYQTLGEFNSTDDVDGSPTLPTPSLGTTTSRSPFVRTTDDPTVMFNCGGTLKSNNGSINYKFSTDEALNQSESCVWTLSTDNRANLILSLKAVQFEQSASNFISVGYFENAQYGTTNFTWQKFVSASTPQTIEIPSPVAFIHFVTSPGIGANSKGFHLEFQTLTSSSSSLGLSYNFANIFLTGSSGSRRYPLSGQYGNSERTSIVVQPSLPTSSLRVTSYNTEPSYDVLCIWMFGSDLVWIRSERLTGSSSTPTTFVRSEPLRNNPYILAFRTDGSGTNSGFAIEWGSA